MDFKPISALEIPQNDAVNYRSGDTTLFRRLFFADAITSEVVDRKVYFLIGEKGTGKTAYATYLSDKGQAGFNGRLIFVQPDDYDSFLALLQKLDLRDSDATSVWQIIFLLILFEHTYSISKDNQVGAPAKVCRGIIDRFTFSSFDGTISSAIALTERIAELAIELTADQAASRSSPPSKMAILVVRKNILEALGSLTPNSNSAIFVDGVDVRPQSIEFTSFISAVRAIVNSVWSLNNEYLQRLDRAPRCILCIRPDILDYVGLQNLNNKVKDNAVVFNWYTTYNDYRSSRLFALSDNILKSQQDNGQSFPLGMTWDHYFPYKSFQRTGPSTREKTRDSFLGFLESSFYKPRDIISLLAVFQSRSIARQIGNRSEFDEHMIRDNELRETYSRYLLGEVRDSLSFYYQSGEFELFRQFFEFLVDHVDRRSRTFTYKAYVSAYEKTIEYIKRNEFDVPVIFETADMFLQVLYELNVIGFLEEGYTPGVIINRWSFRERSFANIRPKVTTGVVYRLHFGIARALYPARMK
ncbi:hypothetical protein LOC51_21300 [Rubrivivax sp. JA1024]|nr:hypothetical protein [Rubrivivax sp. JA1024]